MTQPTLERLSDEIDPESDLARILFGEEPEDAIEFIETYLTIPNENGQVVPFKLYPQQRRMVYDETGRDITVKGRQTRASSLKLAVRLRRMCFQHFGARALIGAQDDETTKLFRIQIKHHIDDLNRAGWDIKLSRDNENEIVIAGRENRFEFVSGQHATIGRGFARQEVHLSELAHWKDNAKELIGGLMPSVPPAPYGHADFESTPAGEAGIFYDYAMDAKPFNPFDEWTLHFYEWWNEPRYRVSTNPRSGMNIILSQGQMDELTRNFTPSIEERALMTEKGLDLNQILWRRLKKREQDKTDAPFIQEFPEDVLKCWVGLSGNFFDTGDGEDHLHYYREDERKPLKSLDKLTYKGDEISFFGPNLHVWELPIPGDAYVIAFDAAGGGIGRDFDWTSIGVWNATKEKRVASCLVQCTPKQAGAIMCAVGGFYGTALASGERSHHGQGVFDAMKDLGYENLYYFVDPEKPIGKDKIPDPGIYPTPRYRQMILDEFKRGIIEHSMQTYDQKLNQQMAMFNWTKVQDRMKAMAEKKAGAHDDVVMEAAQGWFACKAARARKQVQRRRQESQELVLGANGRVIERIDPATRKHAWLV